MLLEFLVWELYVDVYDLENLIGCFMDRFVKLFKKISNFLMLKCDKFDFWGNFMCINLEGFFNNIKINVVIVKKKVGFLDL